MKIDLHVHSRYSFDCSASTEHILKYAKLSSMNAICITDHHTYLKSAPVAEAAADIGFLVLRGAEASTNCGHFLLFGIQDDYWHTLIKKGLEAQGLINYVNSLGGVVIAAHPFRKGGDYSGGWDIAKLKGLVGIETWNTRCSDEENQQAVELAKKMKLPMLGGSDAHAAVMVGKAYSIIESEVNNVQDLIKALKHGRCWAGNLT